MRLGCIAGQTPLDHWIFRAILAETFLIALFPEAAKIALLIGLLLYLVKLKRYGWYFRRHSFDLPVAVFAVLGAASIAVSPNPAFSFYNYYNLVGVYLLTYLLVTQNVTERNQVRKMIQFLAAAAFFVVLYGFYQYVFGIDTSAMRWVDGEAFPELRKRVFSTWENPNILAGYLDAMICLAFGFFIRLQERLWRGLLFTGMVLLAICLAMTYARGACFTLAVVLLGYGILRDRRVLAGCIVVGGALLFFDSTLSERLFSVFTKVDTSSEMRMALWESTVAMIQEHPFLGIGWGAYWMVYPEYDFYLNGADVMIVHAHNMYLNYAAEIGLAGAAAFLWYFFGTMWRSFRSGSRATGFSGGVLLGIGLAILSVALNGITDDVLFNIPSSMLLWLLCAVAAVVEKEFCR